MAVLPLAHVRNGEGLSMHDSSFYSCCVLKHLRYRKMVINAFETEPTDLIARIPSCYDGRILRSVFIIFHLMEI